MLPYTLTLGDQSLKDIYETGTPYTRCIPIPQGSFKILVLFSVKPYIEYRYNYLFTHKSHTAALRSGSHAAGMCLIRQLAVLDCKSTKNIVE